MECVRLITPNKRNKSSFEISKRSNGCSSLVIRFITFSNGS